MPKTIRKYWGAFHGRDTFNYNWPIIDQDSTVIVTASEYNAEKVRFLGAASITVSNVVPHGPPYDPNHGVTFVVNADFCNGPRTVNPFCVVSSPGHSSVRGRRMAAT
jgi:hypothetical protein